MKIHKSFYFILSILLTCQSDIIAGNEKSVKNVDKILQINEEIFELIPIDSIFQIENHGLSRIFAILNGHHFKITTSPAEVENGINTYFMPKEGKVVFNIFKYLIQDTMGQRQNILVLISQGPASSTAEILVADYNMAGYTDYYLEIEIYPSDLVLKSLYPNPFNKNIFVEYEIPQVFWYGVPVSIDIYNILGQRVKNLMTSVKYAGSFSEKWDATNEFGEIVSSGLYILSLTINGSRFNRRIILRK